jgi:hypothetical protein
MVVWPLPSPQLFPFHAWARCSGAIPATTWVERGELSITGVDHARYFKSLPFTKCIERSASNAPTDTLLDRLTRQAHILGMSGEGHQPPDCGPGRGVDNRAEGDTSQNLTVSRSAADGTYTLVGPMRCTSTTTTRLGGVFPP